MTGKTVLLVEDDPAVRKITTRMLHHMGMRVVSAASGDEALALLERLGPVDLLLSDVVLPGMSGMSFVVEFLRRRPETPYLFVTGWFSHPALEGMQESVLAKPFGHAELEAAVAAALEFPALVAA